MQDIDNMNSSLLVLLCALIQFLELDAVYVNIQRYRGYIQRTHNNLRALEGAADMKYMVRNQKKLGRLGVQNLPIRSILIFIQYLKP